MSPGGGWSSEPVILCFDWPSGTIGSAMWSFWVCHLRSLPQSVAGWAPGLRSVELGRLHRIASIGHPASQPDARARLRTARVPHLAPPLGLGWCDWMSWRRPVNKQEAPGREAWALAVGDWTKRLPQLYRERRKNNYGPDPTSRFRGSQVPPPSSPN